MLSAKQLFGGLLLASLVAVSQVGGPVRAQSNRVNILFIMLDDLGKDLLTSFNPDSPTAALTPVLNAIAVAGVRFTNFYTMPECSPSRSAFFTGRYPFRTGVNGAIMDTDLPVSHVSPFEVTTPRVLAAVGYVSALIGKYHLGGPENNPDGNGAPVALGWDYFNGNLRGATASLDASLGGQYTLDNQKYACGFPAGPDRGACWFRGSDNRARCDDNRGAGYTGQQGVALGGIPALDAQGNFAPTCREAAGAGPDFTRPNGYYVWPMVVANSSGTLESLSRRYITTAQTDAAIEWIRGRALEDRSRPWMATVSFNAIHTPYQPPPLDLYPPGFIWPAGVPQNCSDPAAQRVLMNLMLAAMDREIGRLLVSTGLARLGDRGELVYRPEATDTMVVIAGDNGTFLPSVLPPYDPLRAKGTPYETGVLAPMIVSGPMVVGPGRTVGHMVNSVDLFRLFAEIAEIRGDDISEVVPSSHVLDAARVLPFLTNPNQPRERHYNFTQTGPNVRPASVTRWPCVVSVGSVNIAVDIFTTSSVCQENFGVWFGPTPDQPNPRYPTVCAVKEANLFSNLTIVPTQVWALRNAKYKLVKSDRPPCERSLGEYEFYDLSVRSPSNPLGLDLASSDLLTRGQPVGLTTERMANFVELESRLQALLDSEIVCTGDGNLDKRVDLDDVFGLARYAGQPSVFDFNQDGVTDIQDLTVVVNNFGRDCR